MKPVVKGIIVLVILLLGVFAIYWITKSAPTGTSGTPGAPATGTGTGTNGTGNGTNSNAAPGTYEYCIGHGFPQSACSGLPNA